MAFAAHVSPLRVASRCLRGRSSRQAFCTISQAGKEVSLRSNSMPVSLAKELQSRIGRDTGSLEELWSLIGSEMGNFDERHAVSCFARAADLGFKLAPGQTLPTQLELLLGRICLPLEQGNFEPTNVSRLAAAAAATSVAPPRLLEGLSTEAARRASEWTAIDAAMLAHSFAHLACPGIVSAVVNGSTLRASGFGTQALVNIIWAAATVRTDFNSSLASLFDEASSRGERLWPQGLANLVWALGTFRQRRESVLESLLPHVAHRVRHFSPQGIANVLWGLSVLRRPKTNIGWLEEDAVVRLAAQAMRRIEGFGAKELVAVARSTVIFSAAETRAEDFGPLLSAITGEALKKVHTFKPRQMAGLLWALGRHRYRDADDIAMFAEEAVHHVDKMRPEEVGSILWTLATLRLRHELLLRAAAERIRNLEIELQEPVPFRVLSSLAWSHAVLRASENQPLAGGLAEVAAKRSSEGTPQEISNLAWAVVLLGSPDMLLLATLAEKVESTHRLSSQECANAAWAFATAQIVDVSLSDALSKSFLDCSTQPFSSTINGRDWVGMVDALSRYGADFCFAPGTPRYELLGAFEDAIFKPVSRMLRQILDAGHNDKRSVFSLEKFATSLDLGHLGSVHTEGWLRDVGLGLPKGEAPAWLETAHSDVVARRPWQSALGQPPHQRDVVAWVGCDVLVRVASLVEHVQPPAMVAVFDSSAVDGGALQPLFIGHSRAGHAERTAMIDVMGRLQAADTRLRRKLSATASNMESIDASVTGTVNVFVAHTPCLSCLAIFAQFTRCFPDVSLTVTFQDARLEAAART